MVSLLLKAFMKNEKDYSSQAVRQRCGAVCGALGILLNALLFGVKLTAGLLSGSMAVIADSFNNLADAGSSVITLVGFRLSAKKPDPNHPFGHGRIEYLSGLAVSVLIIIMGVELIQGSVEKLFEPQAVNFSVLTAVILGVSVLVKLYMSAYNRKYGKLINSSAMIATAADSLSDAVSTGAVLVSGIITRMTDNYYVDTVCGIIVALLILYAGVKSVRETVSPLLGQPPSAEFVEEIERITMSCPLVLGIHDLIVHDYGPGRIMVSLHAEVSCKGELLVIHDAIDNIEVELAQKLNCEAVIHMDPIDTDDEESVRLRGKIAEIAASVNEKLLTHDFRAVHGDTHTNLIFDLVVPSDCPVSADDAVKRIKAQVKELDNKYRCVIKIDSLYIGNAGQNNGD